MTVTEFATGEEKSKAVEDALVSQVVEQVTGVLKTSSRDRTVQCTVEQILDVPVPEVVNSWWKCRKPFLRTESNSGMWSRSLTFQFRRLWRN